MKYKVVNRNKYSGCFLGLAMAGAIWGAFHGIEAIDESKIQPIENSAEIISLSERLYAISSNF